MSKIGYVFVLLLAISLTSACNRGKNTETKAEGQATQAQAQPTRIGGEPVVTLTRPKPTDTSKPQFLEADILPGRGMNLWQVKAYLPGKGEIEILSSPNLAESKQYLDEQDDPNGYNAFRKGAAILLPWVNRIRGKLTPDGKSIEVAINGKNYTLPAAWSGKKPGAEIHAIHGLITKSKFEDVKQENTANESTVSGVLHAGDFGGHWPSQTDVDVQTVLRNDALEITVTAKNMGQEVLPMGIGFHPYFAFPSGDRKQVKLHLPSGSRALVNNYDDVFPTGKVESVKGTPYDFTAEGGKPLGDLYMDDNFPKPMRNADGSAVVEIIDPAANYGLRMTALSPEVQALQVYAPPDKAFIAVEPQFNMNDPFSKIWAKNANGMAMLKPGQSVTWKVRLELFTPKADTTR